MSAKTLAAALPLGICALLATGCGSTKLPTAKLSHANAVCHRDDKAIAASYALHGNFEFSESDFAAIVKEATDLYRLGLDPRRLTQMYAENAESDDLDSYKGPPVANADLEKARSAAAKLGLTCSFGYRSALSR